MAMLGGATEIKIHGQYVPVRAEIAREAAEPVKGKPSWPEPTSPRFG